MSKRTVKVSTPIGHDDIELGGAGSGNWGHKGRPGQVGGSAPRGAGTIKMGNGLEIPRLDVSRFADRYQRTLAESVNAINEVAGRLGMHPEGTVGVFEVASRVYRHAERETAQTFADFVNNQSPAHKCAKAQLERLFGGERWWRVTVRIDVPKSKQSAFGD